MKLCIAFYEVKISIKLELTVLTASGHATILFIQRSFQSPRNSAHP